MQRQRGRADVFFTGLSAVPVEDGREEPFGEGTRSGSLLREIARAQTTLGFYYTNLVKCLPLQAGRIRYPERAEMEFCFRHYKDELLRLAPRKVVLFGRQVSAFISEKLGLQFQAPARDFDFPVARMGDIEFLAAYHPSFVLVYRRKRVEMYKRRIAVFLKKAAAAQS